MVDSFNNEDTNKVDLNFFIKSILFNKKIIFLAFFIYLIIFGLFSLTFKSKWEGNVILFMKNVSNELTIDALMGNSETKIIKIIKSASITIVLMIFS